jgi:Ca2+/Na+ antiporter
LLYPVIGLQYIHSLYGILILGCPECNFFTFFKGGKIRTWLIGQGAIILFYLPWAANVFASIKNTYGIRWIRHPESYSYALIESFRMFLGDFIFAARNYLNTIEIILFLFLLVVPGIYFWLSFLKPHKFNLIGKKELGLVVIWGLMPIFFYFLIDKIYTPIFLPRYMGYSHIPLLVLVSVGIFIVDSFLKRSHYLILGTLLIIIFYANLLPYYKNGLKIRNADWRGVIQELCTRTSEKTLVILGAHADRPTKYYGKCLKGRVSSASTYEITPENESVFVLQERKRFTAQQESSIKQKGFIAKEEMYKDEIGFLCYELFNKREEKNDVRNTLNRFIKTIKEKISPDDLILITPVSEFSQHFKTNNTIDLIKFIEIHREDRKYYKDYESIFIVHKNSINHFVPIGYLLKEKYALYLNNGGEFGYSWYKKLR